MLWYILLSVATILTIALCRVLRRRNPLNAELYSKTIAVESLQGGVAWLRADGTLGSVNQSLAKAFHLAPGDLLGRQWYELFVEKDRMRIRNVYGQALLTGAAGFEAEAESASGTRLWLNVKLVAAHDRKADLAGLHCLIEDRTRERNLEDQVCALEERVRETSVSPPAEERQPRMADERGTFIADVPEATTLHTVPPMSTAAIVRRAIRRLGSPEAVINRSGQSTAA